MEQKMINRWSIQELEDGLWVTVAVTERYDVAQNIVTLFKSHRELTYRVQIVEYS